MLLQGKRTLPSANAINIMLLISAIITGKANSSLRFLEKKSI